jgi:hypothetical protein
MNSNLDSFLVESHINSMGRLCVLIFVANKLPQQNYPFGISSIVTKKGGQIRGLSGASVRKILLSHGITVPVEFLGEAGRTNRGSVGDAQKFIDWLNTQIQQGHLHANEIVLIETQLAKKIIEILEDEKHALNLLPTSDPNFEGPDFIFTDEGLSLDAASMKHSDIPFEILTELKRLVVDLLEDLGTTDNCYHSLRKGLERYKNEVDRPIRSIRIPLLYVIGLELENIANVCAKDGGDDPPLSPDRTANVRSLLGLHAVVIGSTEKGRNLLAAAAIYNLDNINIEGFKMAAMPLVETANNAGLMDKASANLLAVVAELAGLGPTPRRTTHIAVVSHSSAWSTFFGACIAMMIEKSFENSVFGTQLFGGGGHLIDVAVAFINANSQNFFALAESAPESFGWISKVLDWIGAKLKQQ